MQGVRTARLGVFAFLASVGVLAGTLLAWSPADAPAAKIGTRWLKEKLQAVRDKFDLPALGAAVVTSKGPVLVEVVGTCKRGDATPAGVNGRFHLGSDTKAMTALLVAVLVREKTLAYDLTVEKAFPGLRGSCHADYRAVTLEQLLAHRGGLPANLPGGWHRIPKDLPVREQREKVAAEVLGRNPEAKPGAKFVYSNVSYTLAGHVAEKAGKATWEELMRKRVFAPLKMTTAGFGAPGTADRVEDPWPHREDGRPVRPGPAADNPPVMGPAGRVHASLGDWARFVADQLKGARGEDGLLPAAAYRKLHSPSPKDGEYTSGGWLRVRTFGGYALTHDGSNTMNHCTAWLVPGRDVAVLVACNQGGKKGLKGTHAVRDAVLAKLAGRE